MKIKEEKEIIKFYEDGFYTYGGNGFIEYWEIKNNEVVLNVTISDNQITLIKNETGIPQHSTYYLDQSFQMDKQDFDFAINNMKDRI